MAKLKRIIFSLAAVTLLSGVCMTTSAAAHPGRAAADNDTTVSNDTNETEIENHARDLTEQFRQQAQTELAKRKASVMEHTQQQRQKACEARKQNLDKRMDRAVTQAKKHEAVFDKIYGRVKAFHDDKQLNTPDYDSLVAAVDQAKTDAETSITALESLQFDIDCTQDKVADSVSTFQQALKSTRDSLKDYRKAIVELIKSLKGASTGQNDQSDNETETESTQ